MNLEIDVWKSCCKGNLLILTSKIDVLKCYLQVDLYVQVKEKSTISLKCRSGYELFFDHLSTLAFSSDVKLPLDFLIKDI